MIDEIIAIYEVGIICESQGRKTILITNDINKANESYENIINNIKSNDKFHLQVFVYDYDKNCNINYYDSATDIV